MLKTAIYIKRNSFFSRKKILFKYASEHELNIVKIYKDKPISRINRAKLLMHSKTEIFEVVLVYQLSDLDSNPKMQNKIISLLRKNNVMVVSVKDSITPPKDEKVFSKDPCIIH